MTTGRGPGAPWRARLLAALQVGALLALLVALVVEGAQSMGYNWQWMRVPRYIAVWTDQGIVWGPLARGLVETVRISATAFVMALVLGLIAALLARGPSLLGRWCARGYVELIRNTPLLVQLYIAYFVLSPFIGLGRWWTGVWCLALFEGAYAAEIYRAGLMAVPKGQWEAAASLGLGRFPTYARVILPQALRLMLPPFTNLAVALVKHSSIVSTIAVLELTTQGRNIVSDTFMSFEIWLTVAGIYLIVTITLSSLAGLLERRLGRVAV